MSQLAQVAEIAGVSTADVVRVATGGGTTAADWDIAAALEQVTGRPAAETMWAGPARQARHTPVPTPAAEYDPEVTVYAEDADGLVTDIPESRGQTPESASEEDEQARQVEEVEEFAAAAHSDIATMTGADIATWITGQLTAQPTVAAARALLTDLMDTPQRLQGRLALAA